jgi:hypothetical protein
MNSGHYLWPETLGRPLRPTDGRSDSDRDQAPNTVTLLVSAVPSPAARNRISVHARPSSISIHLGNELEIVTGFLVVPGLLSLGQFHLVTRDFFGRDLIHILNRDVSREDWLFARTVVIYDNRRTPRRSP